MAFFVFVHERVCAGRREDKKNDLPREMEPGVFLLEDFSESDLGQFPKFWKAKNPHLGKKRYRVVEQDGNRFLRVDAVKGGTAIFRRMRWDLKNYPVLEWRWRARQLPEGGDERRKKFNDSAVAIYVVFPKHFFIPRSLKYLWSTAVPVGEVFSNTMGYNKMLVLRSGSEKLGKWIVERRNIREDYTRRFQPSRFRRNRLTKRHPIALGIITDGDQTQSLSSGDYDYFRALTMEAAESLESDVKQ